MRAKPSFSKAIVLLAGLTFALFLFSAWSSGLPDGLEYAAGELGFAEGEPVLPAALFDLLPREWIGRALGVTVSGTIVWVFAGMFRKSPEAGGDR